MPVLRPAQSCYTSALRAQRRNHAVYFTMALFSLRLHSRTTLIDGFLSIHHVTPDNESHPDLNCQQKKLPNNNFWCSTNRKFNICTSKLVQSCVLQYLLNWRSCNLFPFKITYKKAWICQNLESYNPDAFSPKYWCQRKNTNSFEISVKNCTIICIKI